MNRMGRAILLGIVGLALAASAAFLAADRSVYAADHLDPPSRTDPLVDQTPDIAADIADIYAWHTATDLIVIVTFAGPQATTLPARYDRDVLYKLFISNDDVPFDPEIEISWRFGFNGSAAGVQFKGIPGSSGLIEGPVETDLVQGPVIARAGLFDDPFFFDSQGLRETRATGTLSFRNDRNFFGAKNITAVVLRMPRSVIENSGNKINIWSTAARFGGQI